MKRVILPILALLALGAVVAAAVPRAVEPEAVRASVERALGRLTGEQVAFRGEGRFAFAPWPSLVFEAPEIVSAADGRRLGRAARATVTTGFLGILLPEAGHRQIELHGADLTVAGLDRLDPNALDRAALGRLVPSGVVLDRARIRFGERATAAETLDVTRLSYQWTGLGGAATFRMTGQFRGRPVALDIWAQDPQGLLDGKTGKLTLEATAGDDRFSFDGRGTLSDRLKLDGAGSLTTLDARALAGWFGARAVPAALAVPLALAGQLSQQGPVVRVSGLTARSGTVSVEGGLGLRLDTARPLIQGTLATPTADLARLFGVLSPEGDPARSEVLVPWMVASVDLDLLLSAERASLGAVTATAVSGALILRDGRGRIEVSEGQIGQGRVSGHADLVRAAATPGWRGRLKLDGVRIGTDIPALPGIPVESGTLRGVFEADARGTDVASLLDAVDVKGRFDIGDVRVSALPGLAEALARQDAGPLARRAAAHPIRFERAQGAFETRGYRLSITQLALVDPDGEVRLTGSALLPNGTLELTGVAVVPFPGVARDPSLPSRAIALKVVGTPERPLFLSGLLQGLPW